MDKYIKKDNEIIGVENEETFKDECFYFDNVQYRVLITKAPLDSYKEGYYNVYIIDEYFKQEPLNNLKLQEPYDIIEKKTEKEISLFMELQALEHYLWFKYNKSFGIDYENIP